MASIKDNIFDIIRSLIAGGRTRLLVALSSIGGLSVMFYYDRSNCGYYGVGIVIVAVIFLLTKTWTDVRGSNDIEEKK